jgi:subtilisin family serine protease
VNGFSVGSAPAAVAFNSGSATGPYPNPFTSASQLEPFSSDGPRRQFYHADGSPITPGNFSSTGGTLINKPDAIAADGVTTDVPAAGLTQFYGASASAAHAAGIAALIKSYDPALTAAQIRTKLTNSAIDLPPTGFDRDSGAGILMAAAALQAFTPARLNASISNSSVVITWPAATKFVLQQNLDLRPTNWTTVTNLPAMLSSQKSVTLPRTNSKVYFRLSTQ